MTNREIDEQIAEHITGGWYTSNRMEYRWLCCAEFAKGMGLIPADMSLDIGTEGTGQIPLYSTDPVASKQLRDKMRAEGWKYRLYWNGNDFTCTLQRGHANDNWGFGEAEADTEEMAVALAALSAKGKPVQP